MRSDKWNVRRSLTLFVSWVSIIKLWTCFSALVNSSFFATTATTKAVQPAPCETIRRHGHNTQMCFAVRVGGFLIVFPVCKGKNKVSCVFLTIMPVRRQTPFPQYVFGTISPYPIVRNVIEINHMAPRKLLVMSWLS